jgi:hypothetical protein
MFDLSHTIFFLAGMVGSAGGWVAFKQVEKWMAFMDRLYNPPGQRPYPYRRA